jgi:hypothetical protein
MEILSPALTTVCFRCRVKLRVCLLEKRVGSLARLSIRAVIDELSNRNLRGKFSQAAEMIAVPVGRNQMIDLASSRVLDRLEDAAGVARRRCPGIPGINEQRLMGRRDEQRGVATFDIDDVDVQSLGRSSNRESD